MSRRARDAAALGVAVVLAVGVDVGVRVLPLPRLCRLLRVRLVFDAPVGPPRTRPLPGRVRRRWWASGAGVRWAPVPDTCLRRSLVRAVMVRDLEPQLRVGWRAHPAPAVAHAWLEVDGEGLERDTSTLLALKRTR